MWCATVALCVGCREDDRVWVESDLVKENGSKMVKGESGLSGRIGTLVGDVFMAGQMIWFDGVVGVVELWFPAAYGDSLLFYKDK